MSAMCFLLNVAMGNSPALTSFACLEHQTSGFYHTSEANLIPLLIFIPLVVVVDLVRHFFVAYDPLVLLKFPCTLTLCALHM